MSSPGQFSAPPARLCGAGPLRHVAAADFSRVCGARALLAETEADIASLRALAHEQGWTSGKEQAGRELASAMLAQQQAFEASCRQLDECVQPLLQRCLRQLLGELPRQDQLAARLRVLWDELRPRGRLLLRAQAQTLEQLRQHWRAQGPCSEDGLRLEFRADEALGPDDLVLESACGLVDLRLQSQLDLLTACFGSAAR